MFVKAILINYWILSTYKYNPQYLYITNVIFSQIIMIISYKHCEIFTHKLYYAVWLFIQFKKEGSPFKIGINTMQEHV